MQLAGGSPQPAAIIVQIALVFPARCPLSAARFLSPYAPCSMLFLVSPVLPFSPTAPVYRSSLTITSLAERQFLEKVPGLFLHGSRLVLFLVPALRNFVEPDSIG